MPHSVPRPGTFCASAFLFLLMATATNYFTCTRLTHFFSSIAAPLFLDLTISERKLLPETLDDCKARTILPGDLPHLFTTIPTTTEAVAIPATWTLKEFLVPRCLPKTCTVVLQVLRSRLLALPSLKLQNTGELFSWFSALCRYCTFSWAHFSLLNDRFC